MATITRFISDISDLFGPKKSRQNTGKITVFVIRRSGQYLKKSQVKSVHSSVQWGEKLAHENTLVMGNMQSVIFAVPLCGTQQEHVLGLTCSTAKKPLPLSDNEEVPAEENMNQEQQLDLPQCFAATG